MTNEQLEIERKKELNRLIAEQAKDMHSQHVSKDGREFTIDPSILDSMEWSDYQGWARVDA